MNSPDRAAAAPAPPGPVGGNPDSGMTYIRSASGWKPLDVRVLWDHRELLGFLVWRDVMVRYKQTLLGAAWAVMQPTAFAFVFAFVLDRFAHFSASGGSYFLFVYAGMLPWSFFSGAITQASASVVQAERVVTKVYLPRLLIPFASVGACLVDFCIASAFLAVLLVWNGVVPGWQVLLAPLAVLGLAVAALGLGALLSALMVAYRDIRYVIPFLIQLLLFMTPGIFVDTNLGRTPSEEVAQLRLLDFHPFNGMIEFFRATVLGTPLPWTQFAVAAPLILVLFFFGCWYFRSVEDRFADII